MKAVLVTLINSVAVQMVLLFKKVHTDTVVIARKRNSNVVRMALLLPVDQTLLDALVLQVDMVVVRMV